MWTCPKCGSQPARRSRSRSCNDHIVTTFLKRKERETRTLFFRVAKRIAACGPYTLATWKFGVTFVSNHAFAWVNRNMAGRLDIHFVLPRRLKSERIGKIDRVVAGVGYTHHLRAVTLATLDDEIGGWLREAYVHGKLARD